MSAQTTTSSSEIYGDTISLPSRGSDSLDPNANYPTQSPIDSPELPPQDVRVAESTTSPETVAAWIQEVGEIGDLIVEHRELLISSPSVTFTERAKTIGILSIFKKLSLAEVNHRDLIAKEAEVSRSIFQNPTNTFFYFDHQGDGRGEWVLNKQVGEGTNDIATIYYEVSAPDNLVIVKYPSMPHRPATDEEVAKLRFTAGAYYRQITSNLYN